MGGDFAGCAVFSTIFFNYIRHLNFGASIGLTHRIKNIRVRVYFLIPGWRSSGNAKSC